MQAPIGDCSERQAIDTGCQRPTAALIPTDRLAETDTTQQPRDAAAAFDQSAIWAHIYV
ncbi:MAG: hypothetical protein H7138_19475 [Myxococcales bacterium]|nr:hypothetical protein [Myxococcales bacterium]